MPTSCFVDFFSMTIQYQHPAHDVQSCSSTCLLEHMCMAQHSKASHEENRNHYCLACIWLALDCLHRQNLQHPHLQSLHREWCDKKRLVKPQMIVEHVPIHKQGKLLYLEGQSPLKIRTDIIIWKQAKMWPVIDNMWPHTYLPCASLLWQRTVYWPHRHACTRVIW